MAISGGLPVAVVRHVLRALQGGALAGWGWENMTAARLVTCLPAARDASRTGLSDASSAPWRSTSTRRELTVQASATCAPSNTHSASPANRQNISNLDSGWDDTGSSSGSGVGAERSSGSSSGNGSSSGSGQSGDGQDACAGRGSSSSGSFAGDVKAGAGAQGRGDAGSDRSSRSGGFKTSPMHPALASLLHPHQPPRTAAPQASSSTSSAGADRHAGTAKGPPVLSADDAHRVESVLVKHVSQLQPSDVMAALAALQAVEHVMHPETISAVQQHLSAVPTASLTALSSRVLARLATLLVDSAEAASTEHDLHLLHALARAMMAPAASQPVPPAGSSSAAPAAARGASLTAAHEPDSGNISGACPGISAAADSVPSSEQVPVPAAAGAQMVMALARAGSTCSSSTATGRPRDGDVSSHGSPVGAADVLLWTSLGESLAAGSGLARLSVNGLVNLAAAFSLVGFRHQRLLDRIADLLAPGSVGERHLTSLPQLATLTGALAQLNHPHKALLDCIASKFLASAPAWTATDVEDVAAIAGAAAALRLDRPRVYIAALGFAAEHAMELSPGALVRLLRATSQLVTPFTLPAVDLNNAHSLAEAGDGSSQSSSDVDDRKLDGRSSGQVQISTDTTSGSAKVESAPAGGPSLSADPARSLPAQLLVNAKLIPAAPAAFAAFTNKACQLLKHDLEQLSLEDLSVVVQSLQAVHAYCSDASAGGTGMSQAPSVTPAPAWAAAVAAAAADSQISMGSSQRPGAAGWEVANAINGQPDWLLQDVLANIHAGQASAGEAVEQASRRTSRPTVNRSARDADVGADGRQRPARVDVEGAFLRQLEGHAAVAARARLEGGADLATVATTLGALAPLLQACARLGQPTPILLDTAVAAMRSLPMDHTQQLPTDTLLQLLSSLSATIPAKPPPSFPSRVAVDDEDESAVIGAAACKPAKPAMDPKGDPDPGRAAVAGVDAATTQIAMQRLVQSLLPRTQRLQPAQLVSFTQALAALDASGASSRQQQQQQQLRAQAAAAISQRLQASHALDLSPSDMVARAYISTGKQFSPSQLCGMVAAAARLHESQLLTAVFTALQQRVQKPPLIAPAPTPPPISTSAPMSNSSIASAAPSASPSLTDTEAGAAPASPAMPAVPRAQAALSYQERMAASAAAAAAAKASVGPRLSPADLCGAAAVAAASIRGTAHNCLNTAAEGSRGLAGAVVGRGDFGGPATGAEHLPGYLRQDLAAQAHTNEAAAGLLQALAAHVLPLYTSYDSVVLVDLLSILGAAARSISKIASTGDSHGQRTFEGSSGAAGPLNMLGNSLGSGGSGVSSVGRGRRRGHNRLGGGDSVLRLADKTATVLTRKEVIDELLTGEWLRLSVSLVALGYRQERCFEALAIRGVQAVRAHLTPDQLLDAMHAFTTAGINHRPLLNIFSRYFVLQLPHLDPPHILKLLYHLAAAGHSPMELYMVLSRRLIQKGQLSLFTFDQQLQLIDYSLQLKLYHGMLFRQITVNYLEQPSQFAPRFEQPYSPQPGKAGSSENVRAAGSAAARSNRAGAGSHNPQVQARNSSWSFSSSDDRSPATSRPSTGRPASPMSGMAGGVPPSPSRTGNAAGGEVAWQQLLSVVTAYGLSHTKDTAVLDALAERLLQALRARPEFDSGRIAPTRHSASTQVSAPPASARHAASDTQRPVKAVDAATSILDAVEAVQSGGSASVAHTDPRSPITGDVEGPPQWVSELTRMVWVLGSSGCNHAGLFAAAGDTLAAHLGSLSQHQKLRIAQAFGAAGTTHARLSAALRGDVLKQLQGLPPAQPPPIHEVTSSNGDPINPTGRKSMRRRMRILMESSSDSDGNDLDEDGEERYPKQASAASELSSFVGCVVAVHSRTPQTDGAVTPSWWNARAATRNTAGVESVVSMDAQLAVAAARLCCSEGAQLEAVACAQLLSGLAPCVAGNFVDPNAKRSNSHAADAGVTGTNAAVGDGTLACTPLTFTRDSVRREAAAALQALAAHARTAAQACTDAEDLQVLLNGLEVAALVDDGCRRSARSVVSRMNVVVATRARYRRMWHYPKLLF